MIEESTNLWDSLKLLKWNGYCEPLISYIYKLYQISMREYENADPKTSMCSIYGKKTQLLSTIYYLNLISVEKFDKSIELNLVIKSLGYPRLTPYTEQNINDPDPKKNLYTHVARCLGELLLRTTTAEALDCLDVFNKNQNKNDGMLMLRRLIEAYSPTGAQIAILPYVF